MVKGGLWFSWLARIHISNVSDRPHCPYDRNCLPASGSQAKDYGAVLDPN